MLSRNIVSPWRKQSSLQESDYNFAANAARPVVLKVMSLEFAATTVAAESFIREAELPRR
jgi:hypothetical protein